METLCTKMKLGSLILALALSVAATAAAVPPKHPTPEPFEGYAVLMAQGLFDPSQPHPEIPGCAAMFCDGEYFQSVIMGRSAQEIADQRAMAVQHFTDHFGMNADDPANQGRLLLIEYMLDPRNNYRVYSMAGERVPAEGWEVRDGGWQLVVIDPNGFELGGDYPGLTIPPSSLVLFGDYNFLATKPNGTPDREIVYHYQSAEPVVPTFFGAIAFGLELYSDDFDSVGISRGFFGPQFLADGRVKQFVRTVLTFSALGNPLP
jgi:hypothetical protein